MSYELEFQESILKNDSSLLHKILPILIHYSIIFFIDISRALWTSKYQWEIFKRLGHYPTSLYLYILESKIEFEKPLTVMKSLVYR